MKRCFFFFFHVNLQDHPSTFKSIDPYFDFSRSSYWFLVLFWHCASVWCLLDVQTIWDIVIDGNCVMSTGSLQCAHLQLWGNQCLGKKRHIEWCAFSWLMFFLYLFLIAHFLYFYSQQAPLIQIKHVIYALWVGTCSIVQFFCSIGVDALVILITCGTRDQLSIWTIASTLPILD